MMKKQGTFSHSWRNRFVGGMIVLAGLMMVIGIVGILTAAPPPPRPKPAPPHPAPHPAPPHPTPHPPAPHPDPYHHGPRHPVPPPPEHPRPVPGVPGYGPPPPHPGHPPVRHYPVDFILPPPKKSISIVVVPPIPNPVPPPLPPDRRIQIRKIRTLPHDTDSYCQGLVFEKDPLTGEKIFYESAGRYRHSSIKKVEVQTGQTLERTDLGDEYFGEGAAVVGDYIYQLTWREGYCFVYNKADLSLYTYFPIKGEGWGLTFDGKDLIVSDGSDTLTFYRPDGFTKVRSIKVHVIDPKTGKRTEISRLNELEFIDGEIWANLYQTNYIVRIDPKTGRVRQVFNFSSFVPKGFVGDDDRVLNGIAWDPVARRLYVTGKDWPVLYELALED